MSAGFAALRGYIEGAAARHPKSSSAMRSVRARTPGARLLAVMPRVTQNH